MPTTAHAHCTSYWEQEVSLFLKLMYSLIFTTLSCSKQHLLLLCSFNTTVALPDRRRSARACSTALAALIHLGLSYTFYAIKLASGLINQPQAQAPIKCELRALGQFCQFYLETMSISFMKIKYPFSHSS